MVEAAKELMFGGNQMSAIGLQPCLRVVTVRRVEAAKELMFGGNQMSAIGYYFSCVSLLQ